MYVCHCIICVAADDSEEEEEEEAKEPETPQPTPEEREAARAAAAAAAAAAAEAQRLADQQLSKKVHLRCHAKMAPEKCLIACVNIKMLRGWTEFQMKSCLIAIMWWPPQRACGC